MRNHGERTSASVPYSDTCRRAELHRRACILCVDFVFSSGDLMPDFHENREIHHDVILSPEAERQLHLLVANLQDYAIYTMDTQGRIASWNPGAERMTGYGAEQMIGSHSAILFTQEELRAGKPWSMLEMAGKEGRIEEESWRVRKDGSRFWANVVIVALRDPEGALAGYGCVLRDFSERRRAEEELRLSEERFR